MLPKGYSVNFRTLCETSVSSIPFISRTVNTTLFIFVILRYTQGISRGTKTSNRLLLYCSHWVPIPSLNFFPYWPPSWTFISVFTETLIPGKEKFICISSSLYNIPFPSNLKWILAIFVSFHPPVPRTWKFWYIHTSLFPLPHTKTFP